MPWEPDLLYIIAPLKHLKMMYERDYMIIYPYHVTEV